MQTHPLKSFRDRKGISLDTMAQAVGASKASLSRIETRLQVPSLGLVERIVRASDGALSADDFLIVREAAEARA